jgi:hypothetical protein
MFRTWWLERVVARGRLAGYSHEGVKENWNAQHWLRLSSAKGAARAGHRFFETVEACDQHESRAFFGRK